MVVNYGGGWAENELRLKKAKDSKVNYEKLII